jgi:hypothetical protein
LSTAKLFLFDDCLLHKSFEIEEISGTKTTLPDKNRQFCKETFLPPLCYLQSDFNMMCNSPAAKHKAAEILLLTREKGSFAAEEKRSPAATANEGANERGDWICGGSRALPPTVERNKGLLCSSRRRCC